MKLKYLFKIIILISILMSSNIVNGINSDNNFYRRSLTQIGELSAELNLLDTQIEYGNELIIEFGLTNNSAEYIGNVSYILLLIENAVNLENFTVADGGYTILDNDTSIDDKMTYLLESIPVDNDPLIPGDYGVYLEFELNNGTNFVNYDYFEIFPHEGAYLDYSFSDNENKEKISGPIDLGLNESREFSIILTNSGSGNALNVLLNIKSINSPLEVESGGLSEGVRVPILIPLEQIAYNFTVNSPDFGVSGIEFSLVYNKTSGRLFEISPSIEFHTTPNVKGVLVGIEDITEGENFEIEMLIENKENQNFSMKFYLVSDSVSFSPVETQMLNIEPGLFKYNFLGIAFRNGTFAVSLFMTYFDFDGADEVNIRISEILLEVKNSPDIVLEVDDTLTTILLILYLLLLLFIFAISISRKVRKNILRKIMKITFLQDLEFDQTKIIIDGSNVCWDDLDEKGKPKLENIKLARNVMSKNKFEDIIIVVDAALRYQIQDRKQLDKEANEGLIKVLPAKVDADKFILRLSRDTGALILTNDLYKEYRDEFDWIDKKRVPYSIINGELYLHPIYDDDK